MKIRGKTVVATMALLVACSGPEDRADAPAPPWSIETAKVLFTATMDGVSDLHLRVGGTMPDVRIADGRVIDVVATPEDEREGRWVPVAR